MDNPQNKTDELINKLISIEAQGQEFLSKVKTVLRNAKKAGSRDYTAETKSRKLTELEGYKNSFEELAITDTHILEDFRNSLEAAKNILEGRPQSPLPESQINKMPALSEITRIVNNTVPTFFGTEGSDLSSEVCRYIQGCKMVERELLTQADSGLTQDLIQCFKLRLMGAAYSKLSQSDFNSIDAFCDSIKKFYLKKKNVDQIRELIMNSKQSIREPASKFGERLESLLKEAIDAISSEWPEGAGRDTMIADFKRIAVKSFIKGLRDQAIKVRFIGQEKLELNSLVSLVEEAEELFGEGQHSINAISSLTPCSFCNEQGHERINCKKRLNTPYCINCGIYGHEVGPICKDKGSTKVTCDHCRKKGHTVEACRLRLASLYCRVCRTTGHRENQFCGQSQQSDQNQWRNSRPTNIRLPPDRNFEMRNDSAMENNGNGNGTPLCYRCGVPGHFSRGCRNSYAPRMPYNSAPQHANYPRTKESPENNSGNAKRPSYSQ